MMEKILAYIGTYTTKGSVGIYTYNMDLRSAEMCAVGKPIKVNNPSFLEVDPEQRHLYAVSEVKSFEGKKSGAVYGFSIEPESGELSFLNKKASKGAWPCHITFDRTGRYVLIANYLGGNVCVLPVLDDGRVGDATDLVQHAGSSILPRRQKGPHAHSVIVDPSNQYAFVADLGVDKILIYRFDSEHGKLTPNDPPWVKTKPGAGPRTFTFHPNGKFAYVINELDSSIIAFAYDKRNGALKEIQTVSTLPDKFRGVNYSGDIHVAPSGKFLYGSNRGHDSIAIFKVDEDTGRLSCLGFKSTMGKFPRNFAIHPSGDFLFVANQKTDNIVAFQVDKQTGLLEKTGHVIKVPTPTCIKFVSFI